LKSKLFDLNLTTADIKLIIISALISMCVIRALHGLKNYPIHPMDKNRQNLYKRN